MASSVILLLNMLVHVLSINNATSSNKLAMKLNSPDDADTFDGGSSTGVLISDAVVYSPVDCLTVAFLPVYCLGTSSF
ncbi:hypothetical protein SDRG_02023 [Saprolegnia diclina VS20]|uniref:Uncharacterized protein n=1 Tax=Saprolegnia diclina (strain VS20) TaxID=1156394 RepID=T0R3S4_SAPDV|nr:hypothetical protein SDRG_02023 [Saprolegnia diclina VS20]EQC40960.1 hypothetical protein SDRG_02023 [Saprolegnia diclina VS20]|eukprot:XP_008605804.1 hypothetical protein SDRG_02023 [Saprolegnia diclina VS20]